MTPVHNDQHHGRLDPHPCGSSCLSTWQTLLDGLNEAVWIVDARDLCLVAINRAAEELFGVDHALLLGVSAMELASVPEDLLFWEGVASGRETGLLSETWLRRVDDSLVAVLRRVSRIDCIHGNTFFVVSVSDLDERRAVESELEKLVAELRATLESSADGILVADLDGKIRGFNQRFAEAWELPEGLLTERNDAGVYRWMRDAVSNPTEYMARVEAIESNPLLESTDLIMLRNGQVLERVTLPQYARGHPIGRVYSFRNITRRLVDEKSLKLAARVFEASLDAIFVTDLDLGILTVNPACERMTGLHAGEIVGQSLMRFLRLGSDDQPERSILDTLDRDGLWEGEIQQHRHDGAGFPCLVSLVRVLDVDGRPFQFVVFVKDLSEAVAARERIEELAYSDALTGLPNRVRLTERIEFAIKMARRGKSGFAVLFLDLDRFKQINDSLGHLFGDRVLIEVARRIKGCLRQVDTTARLGGDEFVLLLHQTDVFGAEQTARRLMEVMSRPFEIDGMKFSLALSIGIALYPQDGDTFDDLIKNADSAMYHVKERGRGDFRFYQSQMNVGLLSRMKIDHAMREALVEQRFRLFYQPQVDLYSGRLVGAEALVRWTDPNLGVMAPSDFISIAEETGFIVALGGWVLREAIRQGELWQAQGVDLTMSVNVSAAQFHQMNFVESLAQWLTSSRLPASRLELELTESILIQNVDETLIRLDALVDLGIRLAIDDFGTGYSSLAYLKRFPIHKLKIDRSFVQDIPDDESDAAISTAIINLAHSLNLKVIAEGVENDTQRRFLLDAGCDEFQGYLCSPPVDPDSFVQLVGALGLSDTRDPLPRIVEP
ncbi:EAL domain-containing protein [Thiorhodococcus fuscus]|uniref:EAL domain-containing protein n=1 Tax=Thiorhodococcus fuscus TaxID=527200 RepID=A0ABW4Y606_9GAMM